MHEIFKNYLYVVVYGGPWCKLCAFGQIENLFLGKIAYQSLIRYKDAFPHNLTSLIEN